MRKSWSQQLDCWWWRWANFTHFFHPLKSSMWTLGIWKVQLWHWFSWSLVLPIPSLASWKLGWKKNNKKSSSTRQCLLVLLEKSWLEVSENQKDEKKNSRKIQKLLYFSPHQSSRSRNIRWESWPWKLKNPSPQNSGTLGRKLTKIWWKTWAHAKM